MIAVTKVKSIESRVGDQEFWAFLAVVSVANYGEAGDRVPARSGLSEEV
jgi:hypothetical protein